MSETKEPQLFEKEHPISEFILEWWNGLKKNKGSRAELRRCKNLAEIQTTSAYQHCYWQIIKYFAQEKWQPNRDQIAVIIGLSAYIEENDAVKKNDQDDHQEHDFFSYQISRGDKPKLSELRFRRMLKIKEREKLFRFLIQVIRLMDKKLNLLDLLSTAFYWGERARTELAYKYYEKANL